MKEKKDIRTQIAVVFFVLFILIVAISTFQNTMGTTTSYFGVRGSVALGIKVKDGPKEITIYDPDGNVIQQTTLEEEQTTIKLPRITYENQTVDGKTLYFQGWIKNGIVSRVYGPNETVEVSGGETFTPYYAEDPDYSDFTFAIDEETGEYVLAGADSSITDATIPPLKEGQIVSVVGDQGFYSYSSLQTVTLPQTITKIGDHAFCHCERLTSITIPNSVTSIGNSAFQSCSNLQSITIPKNVTEIGCQAFFICPNLTSVTFENTTGWYRTNDVFTESIDVSNPTTNALNLGDRGDYDWCYFSLSRR